MNDSSDSSYGDDISMYYDSSEVEEQEEDDDSENSDDEEEDEEEDEDEDEEEDSENSDKEKTVPLGLDSSLNGVRNRLEMSPDDDDDDNAMYAAMYELSKKDDDDDDEMYDLSKEDEDEDEEDYESSDEEKKPIPEFWFSTEVRNWLELPPEIINMIFTKVGPIDILLGPQYVCTAWQKLSKEPHFYSSIDLRNRHDFYCERNTRYDPELLVICAVNRSAGQLVEFSVEEIATDAMLKSITKIRSPLKCLRLVECDNIDESDLILMAKKLPLLEELEMLHGECCKSVIRGFGRYCPKLKSFRLTCKPDRCCDKSNGQAFCIAQNMPGLHHLDLFGNPMSNTGLIAILDQCLHLKSLDCRRCFMLNFNFGDKLFKRCTKRNIDVKLPDDCCVGCGFDTYHCDAGFDPYGYNDFRGDDFY